MKTSTDTAPILNRMPARISLPEGIREISVGYDVTPEGVTTLVMGWGAAGEAWVLSSSYMPLHALTAAAPKAKARAGEFPSSSHLDPAAYVAVCEAQRRGTWGMGWLDDADPFTPERMFGDDDDDGDEDYPPLLLISPLDIEAPGDGRIYASNFGICEIAGVSSRNLAKWMKGGFILASHRNARDQALYDLSSVEQWLRYHELGNRIPLRQMALARIERYLAKWGPLAGGRS